MSSTSTDSPDPLGIGGDDGDDDGDDARGRASALTAARAPPPSTAASLLRFALFAAVCAFGVWLVLLRYDRLPPTLPATAPRELFSEARAVEQLAAMARVGKSWVGTRANDAVAALIEKELLVGRTRILHMEFD